MIYVPSDFNNKLIQEPIFPSPNISLIYNVDLHDSSQDKFKNLSLHGDEAPLRSSSWEKKSFAANIRKQYQLLNSPSSNIVSKSVNFNQLFNRYMSHRRSKSEMTKSELSLTQVTSANDSFSETHSANVLSIVQDSLGEKNANASETFSSHVNQSCLNRTNEDEDSNEIKYSKNHHQQKQQQQQQQQQQHQPNQMKVCCFKSKEDVREAAPNLGYEKSVSSENVDMNGFISRLESLIGESIGDVKHLYEKKAISKSADLETMEILSRHMKNMENTLVTLYEYRVNPMTFFDFIVSNSLTNGRGKGEAARDIEDEMFPRTHFKFTTRSIIKHDYNGIIKLKGFGNVNFNDKRKPSDIKSDDFSIGRKASSLD